MCCFPSKRQKLLAGRRDPASSRLDENSGAGHAAVGEPVFAFYNPPWAQKIAMTAPVTQQTDGDRWTVRFIMPSSWTMETLPTPNDSKSWRDSETFLDDPSYRGGLSSHVGIPCEHLANFCRPSADSYPKLRRSVAEITARIWRKRPARHRLPARLWPDGDGFS